jgi:hypothetical protein
MEKFRYVQNKKQTKSLPLDAAQFDAISTDLHLAYICDEARKAKTNGNDEEYDKQKGDLPLAFWIGYNSKGVRQADKQTPTQYFYIDIDHPKMEPKPMWQEIMMNMERVFAKEKTSEDDLTIDIRKRYGIRLVHETPGGGLRIVILATQNLSSVEEHIKWFAEKFYLSAFGDVDTVVHDLARGSFMVKKDWIHYYDAALFSEELTFKPITKGGSDAPAVSGEAETKTLPEITEKQRNFMFGGKLVREIAEEYVVDQGGVPEEGLRHQFYNDLIKNFRNICNNDPRIVFAVLPLCEGIPEKRWSQAASICKTNNTTRIPKDFYFWLKKRLYIKTADAKVLLEAIEEEPVTRKPMPPLPPVFREFVSTAPEDFKYPMIVALLPIMGTLTSYLKADYYDFTEQTTSFFSCIWAPPGCGKSFTKKVVNILMKKIKLRDEVNNLREQLWLVDNRTQGKDDKGLDLPHVMVRIMPAINSLPEFLEKMRDNRGYHMFTFAEEVDTFKKGSTSGGSDKSDLFRTAWDNSDYGQSFKGTNTFKGTVKLFYNILLTGTPGAVKNYYSNVEDGMVQRISICEIENQQFSKFVAWKQLTPKQMEIIDRFITRCDDNSYMEPLKCTSEEANAYNTTSANFDKNVKWKFKMRPRQEVDMSWLKDDIMNWLEESRIDSSLVYDLAKDTFRRRTAVKGFRLALLCTACWANVGKREKKVIRDFVMWFMDRDIEESLKMFGKQYNDLQSSALPDAVKRHANLYADLNDTFTKTELISLCLKKGIKSKAALIIHRWKEDDAIKEIKSETYQKTKKK